MIGLAMDAPVMNLGRALEIVASQGWFSKRSAETQAQLGEIAKLRSFAKDDIIYLAGDSLNMACSDWFPDP